MRISVLSFCIVLSLFFVSPVLAQENAPGYANDRFYPKNVTEKQEEEGNFFFQLCSAFGVFECESLRSHEVIVPESQGLTDEEKNSVKPVLGVATEREVDELTKLEKDLDTATTSAQVLGIIDTLNGLIARIFGSGEIGGSVVGAYKPAGGTICLAGESPETCSKRLQIALRPASTQVAQTVPLDTDGDGIPDDVDTDPTVPDIGMPPDTQPSVPPIGPQPPPTGTTAGYDLVAGIKAACRYNGTPGRVHETNADCLYNVSPRLGFGVVPELRNSALAYTNLQCVGFVRGMNLHFKGKALDGGGNANMYATNIPTGYHLVHSKAIVPTSPKVGDLLLWNTGAFGHIAYIITVYDTNYVDVIEANWGVDGLVQVRRINVRAGDILGWLTQ